MKATNQEPVSHHGRVLPLTWVFVLWLLSAFATTAQADALAQPTNVIAREHHATGNRYYRLREFEKAIEEYKAGALREDAPIFSWNLGQCYRMLGRYEDAIWHYERFLDRKPTGEVEAAAKKFIAQMKDKLETKAMTTPPAEPTSPPASNPPARPKQPIVEVAPPFSATEQRRGMSLRRRFGIGFGAVGVAAMSLGIVLGLRAQSFEDDANAICPITICDRADEATELIERGRTDALYANVSFGVAASALVGAAVLWFSSPETKRRRTAVAPHLSPSSVVVTVSTRF